MEKLDLSYNNINYSLGLGNIFELENFKSLDLENTNIKSQNIYFPNNIKQLDLSYNNIENLNNLRFGNSLEYLRLTYNPICNSNIYLGGVYIDCDYE